MSEIMTDDEYEALLDHAWKVTRRFCIMFSRPPKPPKDKGVRITPFNIWSGGKCKTRPVAAARAFCGLTLRCTIGRKTKQQYREVPAETPRGKPKRVPILSPWTVYPGRIPTDGTVEQLSYPLIARYLGGHHSAFILAIKRIRNRHQELAARVLDTRANGTTLATEVAWLAALEEKWEEEARATRATEATLADWRADRIPGVPYSDIIQRPIVHLARITLDSRPVAG